ncbi:MAG TPA: glycosyltransferase [Amycolatopsis sp.]|nr:glycosyltransferase [Amycolatopsis sp.]
MRPVASVVIPAHNEETVLPRLLAALSDGAADLDVVVVANACEDRTAEVAKAAGVRVLETPVAGKPHALRLGDAECEVFPRIYLDADVVLTGEGVRALADALAEPGVLMATPTVVLDCRGVTWFARRVHRAWAALPQVRSTGVGSGAYGLSAAGHARVFPIPDVLTDDAWAHRKISLRSKVVVAGAWSVVRPAGSAQALLRRRARVRLGHRELDRLGVTASREHGSGLRVIARLIRARRVAVVDAACLISVALLDRVIATFRRINGNETGWFTDTKSRIEPER